MKILFSAGGTVGTVAPLLALADFIRNEDAAISMRFVVTQNDAAAKFVHQHGYAMVAIHAGKLRRYAHVQNLFDVFRIGVGFLQALAFMVRWKPTIVISAGSFASVPVVWAAWMLGIPRFIHQQDLRKGLANSLMEPVATFITGAYEGSVRWYRNRNKIAVTGNPVRSTIHDGSSSTLYSMFDLDASVPLLLVIGGSSGSRFINTLIQETRGELMKTCSLLHVTGIRDQLPPIISSRYVAVPYLGDAFIHALNAAAVVVTRAGLSTLSELAVAQKAVIIVPMPETHQEDNAEYFRLHDAAEVIAQHDASKQNFITLVDHLLTNTHRRTELERHITSMNRPDAAMQMWHVIMNHYQRGTARRT